MQWEADREPGPPGPGWHSDPLHPTGRLRWWDGGAWTARVALLAADAPAISWHADLAQQPEPTGEPGAWPLAASIPTAPLATAPLPPLAPMIPPAPLDAPEAEAIEAPVTASTTTLGGFRLEPFTLSDDVEAPVFVEEEDEDVVRPMPTARKKWAMLAAAVLMLLGIGAGVSTAMLGDDQRPTVEPRIAYRNPDADFTFRYPEAWRIIDEQVTTNDDATVPTESDPTEAQQAACSATLSSVSCIGVLFEIGPDVRAGDANTLRVRTYDTDASLGELHEWVATQTQGIIDAGLGRHLVSAEVTTLAGARAFRIEIIDATTSQPTRSIAYEGRTTGGRALSVSVTVRDPRTAPTEKELRELLESLSSS